MVRIPERPYAAIAGERLHPSAGSSAGVWSAAASLGEDMMVAAERIRSQREHDLLVEAQAGYSAEMDDWRKNNEESVQLYTELEGYTKRHQERHREAMDAALERLREGGASEAGERAFDRWATERNKMGFMQAAGFEHRQMRLHGRQVHEARLSEIFSEIENSPSSFADALRQAEESFALAVGQGIYKPAEAEEAFSLARTQMQDTAYARLYEQSPEKALESMDALGLPKEKKEALLRRHEAETLALEARNRAVSRSTALSLASNIERAERQALLENDFSEMQELADAFLQLGESKIVEQLREKKALFDKHAATVRESAAMPLPELRDVIAGSREKRLKDGPAGQNAPGEELQLRLQIFDERRHALATDPAGAVGGEVAAALSLNPEDAVMPQAGNALPGGVSQEQLADMRIAAQANNGLNESGRRVLTNAEAAAYKEQWRTASAPDRLLLALSLSSFGRHTGAVARELGLRAAEHLVLLQVGADPRAAASLSAVIEANAVGKASFTGTRQEGEVADALEHSEVVKVARAATALMPESNSMQSTLHNYSKTLARLVDMEDGDARAAVGMLDGRLKALVNDDTALFFDPLVHADAQGLEYTLRQVKNGPLLDELLDRSGYSHTDKAGQLERLRTRAVWVNAPDGDGFVLWEPDQSHWTLRVRDRDLQRLAGIGHRESI